MSTLTETHPLPPFLPPNARLLMSGSFPPPRRRWSMEWFYPNMQNDMWRIFGIIVAGDKDHFIDPATKRFDKEKIVDFCTRDGIALTDTGQEVVRLRGNASDAHLQIVTPRDFDALLRQLPLCTDIILTGEKAVDTLRRRYDFGAIPVGGFTQAVMGDDQRTMRLWRMPSSSRAYPKPLEWKADCYRLPLHSAGII